MYQEAYYPEHLHTYRFLITGGAGFIGANLVEYLLKHNAQKVRVLDNLATGFKHNIAEFESHPNFEFIQGDIRNLETCKNAVAGMDFVLHQAALGSVPRSFNDPIASNEVNITGSLNMLVASRDAGVKRMIYAASSSTYGDSKALPKQEEIIGKPLSPYAITKYVNELYADNFSTNFDFHTIGLRYFNVFGPKQNVQGAYAAVIPLFFNAGIHNTNVTINGDGNQTRDFTFVENVVQANIKALFAEITKHEVINVAVGDRISVNDLWNNIKEITQSTIEASHGESRIGDVRDSLADISKAKRILGYTPKYTVRDGLSITHDFFKKQAEANDK
ncbi:UDP-N-acetylglucosamine 4-epimerase [Kordia sp. SMS9]|uniref:SDR family oxidoreductase n=1 Tax=Kordia sp. SMS9 TaxID=2282170 RepID=UPI000E0D1D80|nr:SDR family oxidoreductase [Kordia sp. SMS9]AXG68961.1 UDP-N-acetylglucosamine 4-epimerase [Kordia sp. SMS9]